jgi:hypothetical protein
MFRTHTVPKSGSDLQGVLIRGFERMVAYLMSLYHMQRLFSVEWYEIVMFVMNLKGSLTKRS